MKLNVSLSMASVFLLVLDLVSGIIKLCGNEI